MAQTFVIFGLLLTVLLVYANGNNCISKCVADSRQCHRGCVGVTQCSWCIDYNRTCIDNCINIKPSRKRRHTLSEKLEHYGRKWMQYYKLRKELGLY